MDIGLNINERIKVKIGESFDNIIGKLESAGITYKIPFKGRDVLSDNENQQSIVIFLEKYGVELNVLDNKVVYIKSTDYKSNVILGTEEYSSNPVDMLNNIIKKLSELTGVDISSVIVESFDTSRINAIFRIKGEDENAKISVLCTGKIVYIHTVRLVCM